MKIDQPDQVAKPEVDLYVDEPLKGTESRRRARHATTLLRRPAAATWGEKLKQKEAAAAACASGASESEWTTCLSRKPVVRWGEASGRQAALEMAVAGATANYGQLIAIRYTGTDNVTETLKVGGQAIWTGDTVAAGTPQTLTVTVNVPGLQPAVMTHDVVAGSIYALGLSDSHPTDEQLATVKALAPAAMAAGAPQGDIDEANAEALIFSYLHHIDRDEKKIFGYAQNVGIKDVTEGLAGHVVGSSSFLGVPVSAGFSDWRIDVQREANTPFAQNDDNSEIEPINELAGFQGSHWENRVFQEVFNSPAISTTDGLQTAAAQGIALLTLTAPGQSVQLGGYSSDSINEIEGALGPVDRDSLHRGVKAR